jgi:hypothetical protein
MYTDVQLVGHNTIVLDGVGWHNVDWWEIKAGALEIVTERNDYFQFYLNPYDLCYIALE